VIGRLVDPAWAACGIATVWVALVASVTTRHTDPLVLVRSTGQLVFLVVLVAAAATLLTRRGPDVPKEWSS
jgi:hypothetical protein